MLSLFPSPYPDEILYSVCARYHVRSVNRRLKATVEDLFGSSTATAVIDIPNHLEYLSRQLPSGTLNTPSRLIQKNTLLPLFRPFLPQERLDEVLECMKSSTRGSSIHGLIGAMASGIPTLRLMRWCPDCWVADAKEHGEPYWHRSHQLEGISVCHQHKIALIKHDHSLVAEKNKHLFQALRRIHQPQLQVERQPARPQQARMAEGVHWLLNHETPVLGLDALHERYLYHLKKRDLASFSGRISQKELLDAFSTFYGEEFLKETHSPIDRDSEQSWLSQLVRKPRKGDKTTHPLRHLILMDFLGLAPAEFFNAETALSRPFGQGPWPCLNPVADHYREAVITRCTITRNCGNGKPVGNFYCSCGFNYARTGPDVSKDDLFRRGRMLDFGPLWVAELQRLIVHEKVSLRSAAKRLGVDVNTVKKHLLQVHPKTEGATVDDEQGEEYRTRWLELISENPDMGLAALRSLAPGIYMWLYRHDRQWLSSCSYAQVLPRSSHQRVDWAERDAAVSARVIEAANAIRRQPGRPVWITRTTIGKKLGILALLEKKLEKMPLTKEVLKTVVEDFDTYSIRRVRYAVMAIRRRGDALQPWRIVREARLRPGYSRAVQLEIDKAFDERHIDKI
jgi:hypothetical protein